MADPRALEALGRLLDLVARLRAPGGCPWDRAQTWETLRPFLLEEAYEVLDAIAGGDPAALCEELGDLLLQVLLQAEIAAEGGHFTIADVAAGLEAKLVRRHPHVFGDARVRDAADVVRNWHRIKAEGRRAGGEDASGLDRLPTALPALPGAGGEREGRASRRRLARRAGRARQARRGDRRARGRRGRGRRVRRGAGAGRRAAHADERRPPPRRLGRARAARRDGAFRGAAKAVRIGGGGARPGARGARCGRARAALAMREGRRLILRRARGTDGAPWRIIPRRSSVTGRARSGVGAIRRSRPSSGTSCAASARQSPAATWAPRSRGSRARAVRSTAR